MSDRGFPKCDQTSTNLKQEMGQDSISITLERILRSTTLIEAFPPPHKEDWPTYSILSDETVLPTFISLLQCLNVHHEAPKPITRCGHY